MRTFFKTVAVVTIFSISEKLLGFLYRIYLSRTIGAEGLGLYQVALSIFALLLTICSSGTPVTVSRLMTKYKAEGKKDKVYKVISAGLALTLLISVPICVLCYFLGFAGKLSFLFADERCLKIFLVVLPGLVFTSVYAVFRGVFWGNKDFLPYSVIELLEEACMIVVGVVLINRATNAYQGAFRAGVAVLVSYLFSFALSTGVFFFRKNKLTNPSSELKPLFASATPITAMRTATSLAVSLVSVILPLRMVVAGFSQSEAMSAFGAAMGQAMPLLFIPTTLIGSFTLVLIPEIAENYYKKHHESLRNDVEKALKFTIFLTSLFIPVFFICGEEIGIVVFGGHECGKYLTASCIIILFTGLSNISTSMLNSIGLENKTLIYFIISGIFMLLSIWFLPKVMGIYSLLVGFGFVYGLSSVLNLRLLQKNCPKKPRYKSFLLGGILLCLPTSLFGFFIEKLLSPILGTFFTLAVSSIFMVVFHVLLYVGFGLIEFSFIRSRIKGIIEKRKTKSQQKTAFIK